MMTLSGFFIVFCSCISLFEGKTLEDHGCVGMRRGEEYDFFLPDAVANMCCSCDAEWSVDQYTAILDGKTINFSHPFKNVTTYGISVNYCPVSVMYHVSCHVDTHSLTCSCTNSTNTKQSVTRTTLSSTDTPWSSGYKRNHYAAIAVCFGCICLILIFIWRTKRGSAAGQNQTDSSVYSQPSP